MLCVFFSGISISNAQEWSDSDVLPQRTQVLELEKKRNQLRSDLEEIQFNTDHSAQAEILNSIGQINIEMGDINALDQILDEMSALTRKSDDISIKAKLVGLESEFFRLKGLYRHSLQSYKGYVVLQDSIATLNQIKALSELEQRNREREEDLKQKQYANLKTFAYAMAGLLVLAISMLVYGIYKRKKVEGLNVHLATLLSDYVGSYSSKLVDPSFSKQVIHEVHRDEDVNVEGLTDDLVLKILDGLKKFEEEKAFLKDDCTIADVADYISTNKTYLSKVINVVKKKPFTNYINELRLVHAIQLMRNKEYKKYTIKAISKEAGFKSKSTFNNAFKEYTGMTPSEFLKSVEQQ